MAAENFYVHRVIFNTQHNGRFVRYCQSGNADPKYSLGSQVNLTKKSINREYHSTLGIFLRNNIIVSTEYEKLADFQDRKPSNEYFNSCIENFNLEFDVCLNQNPKSKE